MIQKILRARRQELGWSQADVAKKMGAAQSQISEYENGNAQPTLSVLESWAFVLGYRVGLIAMEVPE